MCQTMADREDIRPGCLFYACREYSELSFVTELDRLPDRMNLKLVYVLEHAPADWHAETGLVDAALLRRNLTRRYERSQYFVCGPPPTMDALETILPALNIEPENIHTERFDMV